MRRFLLALVTVALLGPASAARAQGIDQTCLLTLTKFDPGTLNIAFPDDSAQYFGGVYTILPGTEVVIHGRFPHARYMSFNLYDTQLRPTDGITDIRIQPDAGSANPFLTGADRTREDRTYTVRIVPGDKPATPVPNTLYAGTSGDPAGLFLYRIYIPDRGADETGDVGLPSVSLGVAGSTPSASPCSTLSKPGITGVNELLAKGSTPATPLKSSIADPPHWRKFVNLLSGVTLNLFGTPAPAGLDLDRIGGNGGVLSNTDNAYVAAPIDRGNGRVLVTRFRAPTFPDTRPPALKMGAGQLRYWSLCENDPSTQRFVGCVNDDRAVQRGGFVTTVISTPADRPANATTKCGVNWLPWGVNPRGLMILRNMLPAADFPQSIQAAKVDHELDTMGDYFPVSRSYKDAAAYQALGCADAATDTAAATPAGRTCLSRRLITITLPRAARTAKRARVTITGRRPKLVRVRHGKITIDLRGLPKSTRTVTVSARGRTTTRHYHLCVVTRGQV